jgi:PIN domain nuclease of toxin-antitoxin system
VQLLLDSHVLLWAAAGADRLSADARTLIADPANQPWFSAASLWEITIKSGLGRPDFAVDAGLLRRGLLDHGWQELAISGTHALAVAGLPPLHRDPFDRLLVAQALSEGMALVTADTALPAYPGTIIRV